MEPKKSHGLTIYDSVNLFNQPREVEYETFVFSGGEVHIKITGKPRTDRIRIVCRINNSEDLMRLILCVDALRRMNIHYIETFIPYIPYARQDRVMVEGEALSLKVFAGILNSLKLDKVECYDVHSDVSLALIDNAFHHSNFEEVAKFILQNISSENILIVAPDAGACKKVYKMCQHLAYEGDIIISNKIRNVNNGTIISTEVNGNVNGRNCLIVDDVIDGGRTFVELARALKEKGAAKLYLFASHGIFSKGYDELLQHFDMIGTTDSIRSDYPETIRVIKL